MQARLRRFLTCCGRHENLLPRVVHVLVQLVQGLLEPLVAELGDRPVHVLLLEVEHVADEAAHVLRAAVELVEQLQRALHVRGEVLAELLPLEPLLLLALAPRRLVGLPLARHSFGWLWLALDRFFE